MESNTNFLVGICCVTYNHRNYIVDAMNGFTMQQTNFPFVAVIVDDASTDGEPEVINNYIEENFDLSLKSEACQWENEEARYVFAQHKENKNCYFAVVFLKTNYYSQNKSKNIHTDQWLSDVKYVALCEGDDYWTNPNKLQVQAEFMESHTDYSMCFHRASIIDEMNGEYHFLLDTCENRDYSATELVENWIVPTASMFYRPNILEYKIKGVERFISGDVKLFLRAASTGKVRGMNTEMCIYRVNANSLSRNKEYYLPRLKKYPAQYICILENFPNVDAKVVKRLIFDYTRELHYTRNDIKGKIKDWYIMFRYCPNMAVDFLTERIKKKLSALSCNYLRKFTLQF